MTSKLKIGFVGLQESVFEMAYSCGLSDFMEVYLYDRDPNKIRLPKDNTLRVYKSQLNDLCNKCDIIFVQAPSNEEDNKEIIELLRSTILYCDSSIAENKERLVVYRNVVSPGVYRACKGIAKQNTKLLYLPIKRSILGVESSVNITPLLRVLYYQGMGMFSNIEHVFKPEEAELFTLLQDSVKIHMQSFMLEAERICGKENVDINRFTKLVKHELDPINTNRIKSSMLLASKYDSSLMNEHVIQRLEYVDRLCDKAKKKQKETNLPILILGTVEKEQDSSYALSSVMYNNLKRSGCRVDLIDPDQETYLNLVSPVILLKAKLKDIPIPQGSVIIDPWNKQENSLYFEVI